MKRSVAVKLSRFAFEALSEVARNGPLRAQETMIGAIRCYLWDRGSGRPGWPFPSFLRESEAKDDVVFEISIDDGLWRSFEAEAGVQGVSVQQMSQHAALYFAAEFNAGHVTERILGDLEEVA